ncbi:GNAT family N-acetyltransferase [Alkalicoccus chagannorensis]|uniref:GNAT family N-acetyltransferase n=1 Tax=Alkalicoccus chagannorensis TaxID=427072 RepID=UPI0003F81717|nr:GNAT family N-acetyltransferase [Alkalicoccus chagannorensis]
MSTIRLLTIEDYDQYLSMVTHLERDYIADVFERLTSPPHYLYGHFVDGELIGTAGYSIFQDEYAMLGRLRTDVRWRGKSMARHLLTYVKEQAEQEEGLTWVGANTESQNTPARRVLTGSGLKEWHAFQTASAEQIDAMTDRHTEWMPIHTVEEKIQWLDRLYIEPGRVFPFECYYPFPAGYSLFKNKLQEWRFFENHDKDRVVITKPDWKGRHFLQVIYPWNDLADRPGLWNTVHAQHQQMKQDMEDEVLVWLDLTDEQMAVFPDVHPFTFHSKWILHGTRIHDINRV